MSKVKEIAFCAMLPLLLLTSCESQKPVKYDIDSVASIKGTEVFQPDWENIAEHYEFPSWYIDGKFGIFIHWGLYSVPAFGNEWYSRNMYQQGSAEYEHHRATYGDQKDFGYKDFIPMFTAEQFNADTWAAMPTPIRSVWTRWLARLWNQRQLTRFLNTEVKGAFVGLPTNPSWLRQLHCQAACPETWS